VLGLGLGSSCTHMITVSASTCFLVRGRPPPLLPSQKTRPTPFVLTLSLIYRLVIPRGGSLPCRLGPL
jgi:hypothetical protein